MCVAVAKFCQGNEGKLEIGVCLPTLVFVGAVSLSLSLTFPILNCPHSHIRHWLTGRAGNVATRGLHRGHLGLEYRNE